MDSLPTVSSDFALKGHSRSVAGFSIVISFRKQYNISFVVYSVILHIKYMQNMFVEYVYGHATSLL